MDISGNQIRAARALAGIEQSRLAAEAGISINTIRNMEAAGDRTVAVRLDTIIRVRDALLGLGVKLVPAGDTSDGGPGVRLSK